MDLEYVVFAEVTVLTVVLICNCHAATYFEFPLDFIFIEKTNEKSVSEILF